MIAERRTDGALVPNLDVDVYTVPDVPPDQGCDLVALDPRFAMCQTCPIYRCRYELPNGAARAMATALAVHRLSAAGLAPREQAVALGVSVRTITRARRLLAAAWEEAS